jgi:copper chaperone CopZ
MHTLKIDGMTCGHCVMHVKQALLEVDGVVSADVDLQAGSATVNGGDAQELVQAVISEGYSARLA